jgi:hypothetical protein
MSETPHIGNHTGQGLAFVPTALNGKLFYGDSGGRISSCNVVLLMGSQYPSLKYFSASTPRTQDRKLSGGRSIVKYPLRKRTAKNSGTSTSRGGITDNINAIREIGFS